MDDILAPLQDLFEGQIDFHGQRVADHLCTGLLSIFAAIAFIVGYTYEDVYLTLWIGLMGTFITALVVVPPWPIYNKHPEPWLIAGSGGVGREGIVVGGAKR
ncbi:hypothetical protein AJ78_04205 [Emergomyces pasteurianus Ep9510]|uniref:Signal peptidase complex subunit 1 n=1 Tax=Emergomyces pasteurianus Ep9510 TaxID=1447872 RepID=A0A1J9QI02_9EURO|nr:hypothetical protein AJ78_04205 [Emergomyces pasteurianus Ep9510]